MKQFLLFSVVGLSIISILFSCQNRVVYKEEQGEVFGTYYKVVYDCKTDLHDEIMARLKGIDMSLNPFNDSSIISRINRNEDVETDQYFEETYNVAYEVSSLSQGAFDITVAPLVNLYGFGFKNRETVNQQKIDSLLNLVNFLNVNLVDHRVHKKDERIMLDCGAVAKGYACDVLAKLFESHACENYLIEIGGEIVVKGRKADGKKWRLGVTKPIEDATGTVEEIMDTLYATNACFATSGNYRNYYYVGLTRRSHTIDPRSGYPVEHKLLSATVFADNCSRADALATMCMVVGETEALRIIESLPDAGCYFILDGKDGKYDVIKSSRWKEKYDSKLDK